MNTDKAKRLLKRVQALFDNLSDQGTASALERDLLLSYLRDLYEEISNSSAPVSSIHDAANEPIRTPLDKKSSDGPSVEKSVTAPIADWKEPPKPIIHEPVHTRIEQIPKPIVEEAVVITGQMHTTQPPSTRPKAGEGSQSKVEADLATLFQFKEIGELAERYKLQPIERIEHGMGINERILSINELFSGDSELFKKTVDYLNNLESFSDAQTYLMEGVATRFKWAEESRKSKASYFIGVVRRRYAGTH
jgi:hypothetical protein